MTSTPGFKARMTIVNANGLSINLGCDFVSISSNVSCTKEFYKIKM